MRIYEVSYLKEGGNAVKEAGVRRIKKKDIPATITHFSKLSGIPRKHLNPVGSVGKTPTSGDIDLAVDSNEYDPEEIHKKVMKKLNDEGTINRGTKIASYAVPIKGDPEKGKVQVDLMYTTNVEYAKFSYHSEGEGSKYKGAIRAILLSAVAAAINEPGTDHFEFDGDELVIRAGRTLDLSTGLRRIFQHRPKKKAGQGYLKNMKSMPLEDLKALYPNMEIKGGQITVDDPAKIVKVLFGGKVTPDDVRTVEQIIPLIKRKFDEDTQAQIFNMAKRRLGDVSGKMRVPRELE